ncbi:MAG TPA: 30S ribosome-binding factor RbfA [Bacilli bacterium]|nr:30S ribosome-binding factor RbfA [Bacilli bacterium]
MAHKIGRIESIILRTVSETISYKLKNPHLGFVTVMSVEVTKDYSYARVFVSFLGDGDPKAKLAILDEAKGFIRREVAQNLDIRKIPELRFIYDDTEKKANELEELLLRLNRKVE